MKNSQLYSKFFKKITVFFENRVVALLKGKKEIKLRDRHKRGRMPLLFRLPVQQRTFVHLKMKTIRCYPHFFVP